MTDITSATRRQIAEAADDVFDRIRELDSPKDAVMAILVAHVKLTLGEDMDRASVDYMLGEYAAAFIESYFR